MAQLGTPERAAGSVERSLPVDPSNYEADADAIAHRLSRLYGDEALRVARLVLQHLEAGK